MPSKLIGRKNQELEKLKGCLDELYTTFHREFLETDPLHFVHMFSAPGDREVVGLIASSLAYGRVEGIKRSISKVLGAIGKGGKGPHRFVMGFDPLKDAALFAGFKHRFNDGRDIACLLWFAKQMIEESGSIGKFFLKGYSPQDNNIRQALSAFSANVLALDAGPVYGKKRVPQGAGVRFFFPSPEDGSPCKRLNLYLRWMVRRGDGLDFGLWKGVSPAKLVIPLDTHIARISQYIGLTSRANPGWKMAEEITERLKALDPEDPIKYDFALCRLGILDKCPKRKDPAKCESCLIKKICVL